MTGYEWTRRGVIGGAGALLLGARDLAAAFAGADPFTLGVASGEPSADGIVLWTRLAPVPLAPDGGMPPRPAAVRWELADNAGFANPRSGTVRAEPGWGHSVHVEVAGLRPGRDYWYRFITGGIASPVGRTCTAPPRGALAQRLRFAFASCQNYEAGHYAAYRHMVADAPDLIVFLGDYIYEAAPGEGKTRKHPTPAARDLGSYRARYATYKLDPALQAAHQAAPWITTWDDHEVADNYANALDKRHGDRAAFLRRRADAYQAYYEHMPLPRRMRPDGPTLKLYRTLDWGGLAQFQIVDDRQYRDPPPCQLPGAIERHLDAIWLRPDCPERRDPRRSLLGPAQEKWLDAALTKTAARWNLLTQPTLMMPYQRIDPATPDAAPGVYSTDGWEGYPASRERIIRRWRDARTPNPMVLSGDVHAFIVGDHVDPDAKQRVLAAEFVGGSLTSTNNDAPLKRATALNPNFHFAEKDVRGYALVELTPAAAQVRFRGLANARDPASPVSDLARFAVANGRPGAQTG
ncbi:MAG: alkaline phosphatase D family protein [Pseudomonadota bacterium]